MSHLILKLIQFFDIFSIDTAALFSCLYHRCFALIMKEKSCSRITYPQKETEELHLSNITKHALEESLKRLLLKKPLTKITINDLTTDCGISRMTFYYHFKDIYDLVEWACLEESTRALQGKKTYSTWEEGLLQIFEAVYENKAFIMNAYNSLSRETDRKLPFSSDPRSDHGRGGGTLCRDFHHGSSEEFHCRFL